MTTASHMQESATIVGWPLNGFLSNDNSGITPVSRTTIGSRAWAEWYWQRGRDPFSIRRPKIPGWMRAAVLERDGFVCQLCGGDVEPGDVHLDHRFPVAHGGKTTLDNLQVAHSRCNIRKRDRI